MDEQVDTVVLECHGLSLWALWVDGNGQWQIGPIRGCCEPKRPNKPRTNL